VLLLTSTPCHTPNAFTSSYTRHVTVAMLVPIKAFAKAKERLSPVLSPSERTQLAMWMAERVVRSVPGTPVHVVCDDELVRTWAEELGVSVIWTAQRGLNGAVDDGVRAITRAGFDHVIVTHADIPRPERLVDVSRAGFVTLVPNRPRDGTNVMAFPTNAPLTAQYGPGSFARHFAAAQHQAYEIRPDAHLSLDLDSPADLTHPLLREVLPPWLPTNPVNRF
jgi:2-phospho-L-lactate/phosphoenolpyruvate guanylyltransferase